MCIYIYICMDLSLSLSLYIYIYIYPAALVPEGPDDDARVVLRAVEHVLGAVQVLRGPLGVKLLSLLTLYL